MSRSRIVQPSVAKRIAFATWARKTGVNRTSSATYSVAADIDIPAELMVGAQVDGQPYEPDAPKRTRVRRTTRGPIEEPIAPIATEAVDNPVEPVDAAEAASDEPDTEGD